MEIAQEIACKMPQEMAWEMPWEIAREMPQEMAQEMAQENSQLLTPPKVWVSGFPNVNGNRKLMSAIMKK